MSGWRLVTRALYELGRPATAAQIDERIGGYGDGTRGPHAGMQWATHHGLLICNGADWRRGNGQRTWSLTQKGIDWCEGRLRCVERRAHPDTQPQWRGMRFLPTWLASLPRGVRIEQPVERAAA